MAALPLKQHFRRLVAAESASSAVVPRQFISSDDAADVAEGLIAPGNFDQAYGPLAGDTILAFTANGEAHWFRLRQRDGA